MTSEPGRQCAAPPAAPGPSRPGAVVVPRWAVLTRPFYPADLVAIAFLALLIALARTATYGIGSLLKGIRPEALAPYVLGGLLVACALHGLRLRSWLAGIVLGVGGGLGIFIIVGRLAAPLHRLITALVILRPSYSAELGWQSPVGDLQTAWESTQRARGRAAAGVTRVLRASITAHFAQPGLFDAEAPGPRPHLIPPPTPSPAAQVVSLVTAPLLLLPRGLR